MSQHRTQIDMKRLRYIIEVARAESITTAAETLALTQPALTRSIAEVERELGIKLFDRLPRGVKLTESGERFVERARQIVGDLEDLVVEMRSGSTSLTGRLRIGIAPAGYLFYANRAVAALARAHPGISIETIGGSAQDLCPRLLHGELSAVIGSSRYFQRWKELAVTPLRRMHVGCLVRESHPLTEVERPKEVDMLGYPLILPSSVEPVHTDLAQRYAHHSLHLPQPQYATDNFNLVEALLRVSDGFHPMHFPAAEYRPGRGLTILQDVLKLPEHFLSLATSSLQPKSESTALFEAVAIDQLSR